LSSEHAGDLWSVYFWVDVSLEASQMDRKHFVPLAIVEWSVYIVDVRLESIRGGLVNELLLIRGGHDNNTVLGPQLDRLPKQQQIRQANIEYFEARVRTTRGLGFLKAEPRITRTAPYSYVLKYFAAQVKDVPRAAFVAALQQEGIPCDGLFYEPVYRSSLFPVKPTDFPALSWGRPEPIDLRNVSKCPVSERAAYQEAVWFPHYLFLGDKKEIDTIIDAIFKTLKNIEELRGLDHPAVRSQGMSRADRES